MQMPELFPFSLLRCPISGEELQLRGGRLETADGRNAYEMAQNGIPLFAVADLTEDARAQKEHFEAVASAYLANLSYPHTEEYNAYLDAALLADIGDRSLGECLELCCGRGEAIRLAGARMTRAIGVDLSPSMLAAAARDLARAGVVAFVQGDACRLPLASQSFDTVVIIGGIHHVPDRQRLFSEVFRVLKSGGRFYWREPADDFFLWRWIRRIIYRLSPMLDHVTEAPLRWHQTVPLLEKLGFKEIGWQTYGFFGFCLFMNSDVLIFNRLFRFIPFIRSITRLAVRFDDMFTRSDLFRRRGLIVVGHATR